jgi:shikimate kinase
VLVDIASVKIQPMAQMQKAYAGPVVGTHPLFGPDTTGDLRVAVCPGAQAGEEDIRLVEELFVRIGCAPFRTTAQEHDEAVAYIQGLNFVTSAAYFATLADHPEFLPFLTPSFQRRREAAATMLTDGGPLFEALFEANPASQDAVRSYRAFLNLAAGGDLSLLRERALWWWNAAGPAMHTDKGCPPVFLVGPRCCGKTTLAGLLAERFSLSCLDTDIILTAEAGMSVPEIVEREGWEGFRKRESRALAAAAVRGAVVATGGGMVLDPQNRTLMRASGLVIYLDAPAQALGERLARDGGVCRRPSLTGEDPEQEVARVLAERDPLYRASAHCLVDASPPPQAVLEALAALLENFLKPS